MTETNIDLSPVTPAEVTNPPTTPEQTDNNQPENAPENELIDTETATFAPISLEGQTPQVQVTDARGHQETISLDDFKKKYGGLESARVFLEQWRTTSERQIVTHQTVPDNLQPTFRHFGLPISMNDVSIVDASAQGVVLDVGGNLREYTDPQQLKIMRKHLPGFEARYNQARQQLHPDSQAQTEAPLGFPFPNFDNQRLRIDADTSSGRQQLTVSDGHHSMTVSRERFGQWLATQPREIQGRYQYLAPEGSAHRFLRETLSRVGLDGQLANPDDDFNSMAYRLELEHSSDQRVHINENMRQFFSGQEPEPMSRQSLDQLRQLVGDADPQEWLEKYAQDPLFSQLIEQYQVGENPDGTPRIVLNLNENVAETLLTAMSPSYLLLNHDQSPFLRDVLTRTPEMAAAWQEHSALMERLPQMDAAVQAEIERLGSQQMYNFRDIRTLPPEQREAEALRIATVLAHHLNSNIHYDHTYIKHEKTAIPVQFQQLYEESMIANEKRGTCTAFSYFYKRGLEHYGIDSVFLTGITNPVGSRETGGRHAFVGVHLGDNVVDGQTYPRYYIFDPTQGHYGEGTDSYEQGYIIENNLTGQFFGRLQGVDYDRRTTTLNDSGDLTFALGNLLSGRGLNPTDADQMAPLSRTDIDPEVITQILERNPIIRQ